MADTEVRAGWGRSGLNADQLRHARRCYPDFRPRRTVANTGKAVLLAGTYGDQPAVLKVLTDQTRPWRGRFARERAAYEVFTVAPPPVRVPVLLAPPSPGLLLVERICGLPVARHRYLDATLPAAAADALLHAADTLADWTAPVVFTPVVDYPQRILRYGPGGHGVLGADSVMALLALYRRVTARARWQFAHGDLLPANMLLDDDAVSAVLDWEYAGLYLPGYDHALLWVLAVDDPDLQSRTASGLDGDAFWLNAAVLLAREIRIHRDEADRHPALAARLDRLRPLAVEVTRAVATRL
ncbi:Aminoglycoside phosphotransferase [Parafrankia sp. Ea1.12]|uniref:phosphotransferase n=1 Tax=Parafrankia sp. Ea1.12 TaxID=573499 RepID=UPI000DA4CE3E|nr:phosphotransferase [Parafrankia sp. Ea1.12]SQD99451.1 Aminoglycoside phosphotransferase [Parafrankia sp. Ea1.12]